MKTAQILLIKCALLVGCSVFASTKVKYDCDKKFVTQLKENDFVVKGNTECLLTDLDGDGQKETLAFREVPSQESDVTSTFQVRVYFVHNGKISKSVLIDHKFGSPPMAYKSNKTYKHYGCPSSDLTGVIDPGEGGTNYIYLWQPKTSNFKEFTCRSEDE